jgi:hypothetical protein
MSSIENIIQLSLCITTKDRFDTFLGNHLRKYVAMLRGGVIQEIVVADENGEDAQCIRADPALGPNMGSNFRVYINTSVLGVAINKMSVCQYGAPGHFVVLMDSDNFADESYFQCARAYIQKHGIQTTDWDVLCPVHCRPFFDFGAYAGQVYDRARIREEYVDSFFNVGNYVMTEAVAKYIPTVDADVPWTEVGALDVMYMHILRLRQLPRYRIRVVPGLAYDHAVHGGSEWILTKSSMMHLMETRIKPKLKNL